MPTAPAPVSATETDEVLYHQIWAGDLRAFDLLYRRYAGPLLGFLLRMVQNHHDAEDLFHEAFLSVLRSRQVTFDRASFATWLYRIARNLGLNHLRTQRRRQVLHAQSESLTESPSRLVADEALAENESAAELGRAVDALPATLAELYRLRTSGLSYEEMATRLQLPLGTVKSRMNQMTLQLQARLQRLPDGKE